MGDDTTAPHARCLRLREEAGRDLVPDEAHALAIAGAALRDIGRISRARAVAGVADRLAGDADVERPADVDVLERDPDLRHHVRPPRLPVLLSSAATEELSCSDQRDGRRLRRTKHIERVVLSGRLARLMPLETLFAMPVEDLPLLGIGQDLVRLRDGDEFVVRGCIARILVAASISRAQTAVDARMILLRQLAIGFLDCSRVGRPPDAELVASQPHHTCARSAVLSRASTQSPLHPT